MSYDLLFYAYEGDRVPPEEVIRSIHHADETKVSTANSLAQRRDVVTALLSMHSSLRFEQSEGEAEFVGWIGSDDDSCPYPGIDLYESHAFTGVSYSSNAEAAQTAFNALIKVFAAHRFVAFDPQLDRVIAPNDSQTAQGESILATRSRVVTHLQGQGEIVFGQQSERFADRVVQLLKYCAIAALLWPAGNFVYNKYIHPRPPVIDAPIRSIKEQQADIKRIEEDLKRRASESNIEKRALP